ncbi:hypothetical protein V3C99_000676 [Haemonchus contortus]
MSVGRSVESLRCLVVDRGGKHDTTTTRFAAVGRPDRGLSMGDNGEGHRPATTTTHQYRCKWKNVGAIVDLVFHLI